MPSGGCAEIFYYSRSVRLADGMILLEKGLIAGD